MAAKYFSTDHLPVSGSGEQSDARAKGPMEGWDSYRRWLANVTSRHSKRSELDSSLYTWAGYRDWVKKVQSEWDEDA